MNSYRKLRDINVSVPVDAGGGSGFDKVAVMAGLAEMLNLKTYVEIGVYRGRSFFPLAWSFGQRDGYSYGIDPYTRADALERDLPPEIVDVVNDFFEKTDYDALYHEVLRRQVKLDLHRCSCLVRQTSQAAIDIFAQRDITPDMIHIDGNHDTVFVMADVEAYIPILKENGILVLDDINWDSVKPALAYARERLTLVHQTETFAILVNAALAQGDVVRLGDECRKIEDEAHALAGSAATGRVLKVSVSMITYNQERYIAQAIESALAQVTDFDFEIVIGEDASSDRTRAICLDFQSRYPDKIRVIERSRNVGAVRNYLENYKLCEGRYIAYLEGDDFWTDPLKLQRQVDFLDAHPDYAICCHNVYVTDETGALGEPLLKNIPETTTVRDLCGGDYISTPACMVRNRLVRTIPPWIYDLPGCDWPFDILNAEHGKIKFLPEAMAAYRRHSASIWSSLDGMQQNLTAIALIARMNRGFEYRYDIEFRKLIDGLQKSIGNRERASLRAEIEALQSALDQRNASKARSALARLRRIYTVVRTDPRSVPSLALRKLRHHTPPAVRPLGRPLVRFALKLNRSIRERAGAAPVLAADLALDSAVSPAVPHSDRPALKADLVILDNAYPHPQSAFRLEEFDVYLERFPRALVLTTGTAFNFFKPLRTIQEVIGSHERQNPHFKGRVKSFDRSETVEAKLAYMVFAGNSWENIEFVERNKIPFVFTLYPGGFFLVDDEASDERLRRVFDSPLFRRVIVTQKLSMDYILRKGFCAADKVHFVYGVVTPRVNLLRAPTNRLHYGFGKDTLDICFTAHKYMPDGRDKGYDVFLQVARLLSTRFPDCRFHVVGGYEADDLPIDGLEGRISFHSGQEPDWFVDFYRDKDLILLCNVPFILMKGAFDGFPTGCGSDAMLHELALFCTDPLKLNSVFEDGRDLVIVPHDAEAIAEKIARYRSDPAALKAVGEQGAAAARGIYSFEKQMAPRLDILRAELER